MAVKQLRSIFQLKVTLMDCRPPIWRRIIVPSNIKLNDFHMVIQLSMGWTDSHLHQFISGTTIYSMPYDEFDDSVLDAKDERKFKLSQVLKKENDSLKYEYDFGDGWEHKILLEKILPFDGEVELPRCIKGKRSCPPEDCGGIWGYEELINKIQDTSHPEHEAMLEWVGDYFHPEQFNLKETNELLSKEFAER